MINFKLSCSFTNSREKDMKAKKAFEKLFNYKEKYKEKGEKVKEGIIWKLWNQIVDQYSEGPNVYFEDLQDTEIKELFSELDHIKLEGRALKIYRAAAMLFELEE